MVVFLTALRLFWDKSLNGQTQKQKEEMVIRHMMAGGLNNVDVTLVLNLCLAQVENVRLVVWSSGKRKASSGTLYLSATHTIFVENHPETRQETWVSSFCCVLFITQLICMSSTLKMLLVWSDFDSSTHWLISCLLPLFLNGNSAYF